MYRVQPDSSEYQWGQMYTNGNSSHLFGIINKAFQQELSHGAVHVAAGRPSETVVPVSVPLKANTKIQIRNPD